MKKEKQGIKTLLLASAKTAATAQRKQTSSEMKAALAKITGIPEKKLTWDEKMTDEFRFHTTCNELAFKVDHNCSPISARYRPFDFWVYTRCNCVDCTGHWRPIFGSSDLLGLIKENRV